jgi:hypothetical protein
MEEKEVLYLNPYYIFYVDGTFRSVGSNHVSTWEMRERDIAYKRGEDYEWRLLSRSTKALDKAILKGLLTAIDKRVENELLDSEA